jgi:hypothetical protein
MRKRSRIFLGSALSFAVLLSGCGQENAGLSEAESTLSVIVSEPSQSSGSWENSVFGAEESSAPREETSSLGTEEGSASGGLSESSAMLESVPPREESSKEPEKAVPSQAEPNRGGDPPAQSSKSEKDLYLTDPIPEGKPAPVEPQDAAVDKGVSCSCTLSIRCDTILDHMDDFNMDKESVLPSDGTIFAEKTVAFYEGESVFDVLLRETRNAKIHMEFESTPMYNSNYIEGIHNLYEFDCGPLSGWMYRVNGWFPNYGCSRYQLEDGDRIEWLYTCDLGRDLGCEWLE